MGDNAGWIGGVPGQSKITPTWLCQPGGGSTCAGTTGAGTCSATDLQNSLQCPDSSCKAKNVRTFHMHPQMYLLCPESRSLFQLSATITIILPIKSLHVQPAS